MAETETIKNLLGTKYAQRLVVLPVGGRHYETIIIDPASLYSILITNSGDKWAGQVFSYQGDQDSEDTNQLELTEIIRKDSLYKLIKELIPYVIEGMKTGEEED